MHGSKDIRFRLGPQRIVVTVPPNANVTTLCRGNGVLSLICEPEGAVSEPKTLTINLCLFVDLFPPLVAQDVSTKL